MMKAYVLRRHPWLKIALLVTLTLLVVFRNHVLPGIQLAAMPLLFKLGNVSNPLTLAADNFDVTFQSYSTRPDAGVDDSHNVVPPIIHNIFIGNNATLRPSWEVARASCRKQHPGYTFEFWDEERAQDFVQRQFPAVWPMWRDYEFSIQKADSLRYMILYYYGGKLLNLVARHGRLPKATTIALYRPSRRAETD
jgi:inositol phosphorylceramide mannosyltransferase catalytic subunit